LFAAKTDPDGSARHAIYNQTGMMDSIQCSNNPTRKARRISGCPLLSRRLRALRLQRRETLDDRGRNTIPQHFDVALVNGTKHIRNGDDLNPLP
jgi:hypothetical protein